MRIWSIALLLSIITLLLACGERQAATPLETFKTYTKAIKKKDADTMKLLLSDATIKMHEGEAKAMNSTLDEILGRDSLFNASQKSVEYRDEKIEGDKATLQVKNSFGSWETVPFVREGGVWKIDKQGQANQMMNEIFNRQKQAFGGESIRGQDPAMVEELDATATATPEELQPQEY